MVTEGIKLMKLHFGELTVTRGKKHRFLGMNIEINKNKNIEIEMKDQLLETTHMFEQADGSEVNSIVTAPTFPHFRDVNPECAHIFGENKMLSIP